jgi:hypothetical protein
MRKSEPGRPVGRPGSGGGVRGTCVLVSGVRPSQIDAIDTGEPTTGVNQSHADRSPEATRNALSANTEFPGNSCLSNFIEKSLTPGVGEDTQRVDIVQVHHLSHPSWHPGTALAAERTSVRAPFV